MPPVDVASAIGSSPGSSAFRDLLSASFKYGLTTGAFNQPRVALTSLGLAIVAPVSADARRSSLVQSSLNPQVFKSIFEYYKGKKLPESPYFENAVSRELGVPKESAKECVEIFAENAEAAGLVRSLATGKWLVPDIPTAGDATPAALEDEQPNLSVDDRDIPLGAPKMPRPPPLPATSSAPPPKNLIFVGHGKNRAPLEQLRAILDHYKIPFTIATEEANRGRPISVKVADTMKQCGAAILIFSADEELQATDGKPIWKPNENVVHELGAASILYDRKIVIFKEEGVDFPSNFRDLGYITFPKDDLTSKTNELFKELMAIGIIKVSVGTD